MTEDELRAVVLPEANVGLPARDFTGVVEFHFQQNSEDVWYLWGCVRDAEDEHRVGELLPQEEIADILEDVQDIDQYCQTEEFREKLEKLAIRTVANTLEISVGEDSNFEVELQPYLLQQHAISSIGEALFLKLAPEEDTKIEIPEEFVV
ncbi:MAG: hypothetical protein J7M15_06670, partial [Anaerolineae bacterium]|nr:hypothetical protein [Anaerolineae bacterium]